MLQYILNFAVAFVSIAGIIHASEVSDQELSSKIHDKIGSGYFSKGYDQVTVQVKDGVVTLQGQVQNIDDKNKLDKEVRNMNGVKELNSEVTVVEKGKDNRSHEFAQDTYLTSADEQLNNKIRDKVSRGWLWNSYKNVKLKTSNGVVTLEGNVNDLSDQQKIMTEIQKVEGVKQVKSDLKINNVPQTKKDFKQDTFASQADEALNRKIRNDVSRGWLWDSYKEVVLNTSNGNVTLEGNIDTTEDQQKLINEIQQVPGVKSVTSNLNIKKP